MQKKLFLQKNLPKGKHAYLKLFLWSAVALIVLVLVTPLLMRHKGSKDATRKPIPEKGGMVVKEIPKTFPPVADNSPSAEGNTHLVLNETPPNIETPTVTTSPPPEPEKEKPASVPPLEKSIQVDVSPKKSQASAEAQQKDRAAELAMAQPSFGQQVFKDVGPTTKPSDALAPTTKEKPGQPGKPTQPVSKPEQATPAAPSPAAKTKPAPSPKEKPTQAKPSAKPPQGDAEVAARQAAASQNAKKTQPQKKSLESGPGMFAVQVGSFKEKQHAEEMQRALQKKGYDAQIRPFIHPKLGPLFAVQLQPVSEVGKAHTQMLQIRNEEKVKPVIIKIPTGQ